VESDRVFGAFADAYAAAHALAGIDFDCVRHIQRAEVAGVLALLAENAFRVVYLRDIAGRRDDIKAARERMETQAAARTAVADRVKPVPGDIFKPGRVDTSALMLAL